VAITPDGTHAISGGRDGTVRQWNLRSARQRSEPLFCHDGPVDAVAITPDGTHAISGGGRTVQVWNLASNTSIDLVALNAAIASCAMASDTSGLQVVAGDTLGAVTAWLLDLG
jgi:WD40 repeat protein